MRSSAVRRVHSKLSGIAVGLALGLLVAGGNASGEATGSKVFYPNPGGGISPSTQSLATPDDKVFNLSSENPPEADKYINGRPVADQSPLYRGRTDEIEKECASLRDAGKMSEFRDCFRMKREQAISEVQSAYDRTARQKETPLRKTQSDNPAIEAQRKANAAFEAEENN